MNILQITPRLPAPPNDGGAVYIYYTTKYLSQLGENVTLASLISNKHEQDVGQVEKYAVVYAEDGEFTPYSLLSVVKSTISRKPITIQHRMDTNIMRETLKKIDTTPDVILLEGLHTAAFLEDVRAFFPQPPVVLRQSNVEYLLLKRNAASTKNPLLKAFYFDQYRLMKQFELHAMKNVDAVTAITAFDRDIYLKELPGLNCYVSPAGAEIPELIGHEREENKLLAISNWRWKPNIDGLKWFLEEVWPSVLQKRPELEFDVIGDGLTSHFKNKYARQNIRFLGFVDDLEPHRQSATVFVAPLFSGSGMKLKIVEGMASGLPIVTTKIGAEGIEIEDGVHYQEANTKAEFEASILDLLDHPQKRGALSTEARNKAENKYGWEEITRQLIQFLETLR